MVGLERVLCAASMAGWLALWSPGPIQIHMRFPEYLWLNADRDTCVRVTRGKRHSYEKKSCVDVNMRLSSGGPSLRSPFVSLR